MQTRDGGEKKKIKTRSLSRSDNKKNKETKGKFRKKHFAKNYAYATPRAE
jgi:hypothetical protein